ncbi:MAG: hypothetical protein ABI629_03965 [bacterium]
MRHATSPAIPSASVRCRCGRACSPFDRRNPSKVCLRVLRRLSYTEPDPIGQYDKLRSAFDIADWSEEHFNNRALFSDHYLRQRLPELPPWKEDPKPALRQLRALYERAASRWADEREDDLRRGLLEPALSALGFDVETMKAPTDDRREPDYHLRASAGGPLLAVCLAYRWGRFLDGKDEQRDTDTPEENPAAPSSACSNAARRRSPSSLTASIGGSTPPRPTRALRTTTRSISKRLWHSKIQPRRFAISG